VTRLGSCQSLANSLHIVAIVIKLAQINKLYIEIILKLPQEDRKKESKKYSHLQHLTWNS